MALTLVDRYKQLLALVPAGSFYDASGMVVPFRSTPYSVQVQGDSANVSHFIFINGVPAGSVTSNGSAVVNASINLVLGDNEIRFLDQNTGKSFYTHLTTRHYATWMAALAEVVGDVDVDIETTLAESRLATSTSSLIGKVFGRAVNVQNDFNYGLEAYRLTLQQLRTAFRYYGGTNKGLADTVRAFTQVSPLVFDRHEFGPLWVLGEDLLRANTDLGKPAWTYGVLTRTQSGPPVISNINAMGAGIDVVASGNVHRDDIIAVTAVAGTPPTLALSVNGVAANITVPITSAGRFRLPQKAAYPLISRPLFNNRAVNAQNDKLFVAIGDRPYEQVSITNGAPSAATIVSDIQTALTGSLSYGGAFTSYVREYDPLGVGPLSKHGIELFQNTLTESVSVKFVEGNSANFCQAEFDIPYVRAELAGAALIGATSITVTVDSYLNAWPSPTASEPIYAILPTNAPFQYHFDHPSFAAVLGVTSGHERVQITSINKSTGVMTLASALTANHDSKSMIFLEGTDVVKLSADTERYWIDVTVADPSQITSGTDTFTLGSAAARGSGLPYGWYPAIGDGTSQPIAPFRTFFNLDHNSVFGSLQASGDSFELQIPFTDEIMKYTGWKISFDVWYNEMHDTVLTSATDSFTIAAASAVTNVGSPTTTVTLHDVANSAAIAMPRSATITFTMPPTATSGYLQIQFNNQSLRSRYLEVHKISAYITPKMSAKAGITTPQSEHTNKTGTLIYTWSPTAMSSSEDQALGLTVTTQDTKGAIDAIAPAQASLQKFDLSTYDMSGNPTNLFGAFTDTDFLAGTSTNLTLVPLSPAKFSYLKPNEPSIDTVDVIFNPVGPYTFTLPLASTENLARCILTENGVPVTQDQWQFNSPTEIELLYAPLGAAEYAFEYEVLHQFETAALDLTASVNSDRIYYFDYHVIDKPKLIPIDKLVTVNVQFDATGTAQLPEISNMSKENTTLIADQGLQRVSIIPQSDWEFIDDGSIRINPSSLRSDALYTFTYTARALHPLQELEVKLEYRTGTSLINLAAASYQEVFRDAKASVSRYVQLRLSIANFESVDDAKIMSLCLRQLSTLSGSTPVIT